MFSINEASGLPAHILFTKVEIDEVMITYFWGSYFGARDIVNNSAGVYNSQKSEKSML